VSQIQSNKNEVERTQELQVFMNQILTAFDNSLIQRGIAHFCMGMIVFVYIIVVIVVVVVVESSGYCCPKETDTIPRTFSGF
jgi:ABC-type uncharacterized transport system fused permease/ATPase subunit